MHEAELRARRRWRSSLYLRVVATTLALSMLVVVVLGQILVGRITSGLLDAKQRASLVEAQAGVNQARAQLVASGEEDRRCRAAGRRVGRAGAGGTRDAAALRRA